MELKLESITLSSLVRRALNPTSILICFSRERGGVLAPGFLRSLYRRVQGILRSLILDQTEARRVEKKIWRSAPAPPPYLRVWVTTPPPYLKVWIRH